MTNEALREFEALRALYIALDDPVTQVYGGDDYCAICGSNMIIGHDIDCAWVVLQEFNITAPDTDPEHQMIRDLREGNNTRVLRYADEVDSE